MNCRKKLFCAWISIMLLVILLFGVIGCGNSSRSTNTIEKLRQFSVLEKVDTYYEFTYPGDDEIMPWVIRVTDSNTFIKIYDFRIADVINSYTNQDVMDGNYVFGYDFDENRLSIYINSDLMNGLSEISYFISKDKIELICDGKRALPAESFEEYLRSNSLFEIMQDDLKIVRSQLNENGVSFEDVQNISFSKLEKMDINNGYPTTETVNAQ